MPMEMDGNAVGTEAVDSDELQSGQKVSLLFRSENFCKSQH